MGVGYLLSAVGGWVNPGCCGAPGAGYLAG